MGKSKQMFISDREHEIQRSELYQCSNELILLRMKETKITKTDALKSRVINAKMHLPNQIVPVFVHVFPEYDTDQMRTKLTNVLQLKTADAQTTEKLEQLIEILKTEKC